MGPQQTTGLSVIPVTQLAYANNSQLLWAKPPLKVSAPRALLLPACYALKRPKTLVALFFDRTVPPW